MYYIDYHTHTKLSPDGEVPLAAMAEAAVQAGLTELCVTDHYDLVDLEGKPEPNGYDWVPALEQWRETAERYRGRLIIRLGMEFGSADRYPDRARATLDQPELDFVIGSLHNLTPEAGAKDFYFVDYTAPEVCYACLDDYFAQMLRLAPLPDYDSLGHIIYPLRYMCMRDGQTVTLDRYWEQIREILRSAATFFDAEAARHLFEVAAGLDSRMVGEAEAEAIKAPSAGYRYRYDLYGTGERDSTYVVAVPAKLLTEP